MALGTGELADYHVWRAPLHAWVLLGLAPLSGGLVPASQLLAWVSITAMLGVTWWMGRQLLGARPALLGIALLAGWPDLVMFARASTPYPLNALLITVGLAAGHAALRRHPGWATPGDLSTGPGRGAPGFG